MLRMRARQTFSTLLVASTVASALLAGLAAGGSHYPLSVQLWNEEANGLTTGQTYVVWAQVNMGEVPTNATNVTFRVGLGVINQLFPAVNYTGTYAGSPGLYNATVSVTFLEVSAQLTGLAVFVTEGGNTAFTARLVAIALAAGGPGPSGPWTVVAGVENLPQLGAKIDPGEKVVWRVDTFNAGVHENAPSLALRLFTAPDVDFTGPSTGLTATAAGTGIYTVETQVPANATESRQYVLQATVNETNWAQVNASADLWFVDTVVDYSQLDGTAIAGVLTIGDGKSPIAGADVALQVTENGVPSHVLGPIQGQADAGGKFSFTVPNDGTTELSVRGWINQTGTHGQFVAATISLPPAFTPPAPNPSRFDAVPQVDISQISWAGTKTIEFQFFANGTVWSSHSVVALVSSARGAFETSVLSTDASGKANLTIDFDLVAPSIDDAFAGGINLTFRSATGIDSSSSDGAWWGEDEEVAMPDAGAATISGLFDRNLKFTTETMVLGAPFGVGMKYTGPKDLDGYRALAVLEPSGLAGLFGGFTADIELWTGHDAPFIGLGFAGNAPEYFAKMGVPAYWPNTTYMLIGAVVPSYSIIGSGGDPLLIGAINWTTLAPGGSYSEFVPSFDTTPPQIFTPDDLTINNGDTAFLWSEAYDDSLDFASNGVYEWTIGDLPFQTVVTGNGQTFTPPAPGDYNVSLKVTDSSANFARRSFVVHVLDVSAPSVDAGADFLAYGGALANFTGTAIDDDPAFVGFGIVNWSFTYNGSLVVIDAARASPSASASFTFWTLGAYNVTLTAEDAAGHVTTDVVVVTVVSPDTVAPTVAAGPDRVAFASVPKDFHGIASDNDPNFPLGATCGWTFVYNGSAQDIPGSDFTFTFWTLGSYDLLYFCLDFWGNLGQDTVRITVDRPDQIAPVADAGADVDGQAGITVSFDGSATDNDPNFTSVATYWWLFEDQSTPVNLSGPSFNYLFTSAGDYTVTLFVRDGWGNVGSDTVVVHIEVPDTAAPAIPIVLDQTVALGGWLNLTTNPTDDDPTFATTGNISWNLTLGGAPVRQYGRAFSLQFTQAGNYTVTIRATDASGNLATRTFIVRVPAPDVTAPVVTAAANPASGEAGLLVTFAGSAIDAGAAITESSRFTWTFTYNGSVQTLHGMAPTFRFDVAGNYTVTLTVSDATGNVGSGQTTVSITEKVVSPPPPPPAGSDFTLLILLALLAAAGVGALLVTRRRRAASREPRAAALEKPTARPHGAKAAALPEDDEAPSAAEDPDEDRDLDDLLK